ncbi:hypothetical protein SAMN05445504_9325 [Burkholderia sp. CF099]|nr:hypothetical protein SAMN05445504_9325 [Burkholderia sp. CF099]
MSGLWLIRNVGFQGLVWSLSFTGFNPCSVAGLLMNWQGASVRSVYLCGPTARC